MDGAHVPDSGTRVDPNKVIEEHRSVYGPGMVSSRREYEHEARRLLDESAGRMDRAQGEELLSLFNTGEWAGDLKRNRFAPAFVGDLRNRVLEDMEVFNDWTARLWHEDEQLALEALDELFREPSALPGAGRSYPSLLFYLRDSERFAVCMTSQEKGLAALTDYQPISRNRGADGYLQFCEAVHAFRRMHDLRPQELDAVLAEAAARARTRSSEPAGSTPTLSRDAFVFLRELELNNNRAWFDANRDRYQQTLREPFRQVLSAIADRFIVELDPEIDTEIKANHVLASIRKRFPDEEGEYYDYYWGAFSRHRKQEDVQLYVNIHTDRLDFGLTFGVSPKESLELVRGRIRDYRDRIWEALLPHAADLVFADMTDEQQPEASAGADVDTPDALVDWFESANSPSIFRSLPPDHDLIGSPELVGAIGELLTALHPLAALAWDEEPDSLPEPGGLGGDEPVGDDYPGDQFAHDTFLPPELLEEWEELISDEKRRQMLFYGPPGTGKSFVAERLATYLAGSTGKVEMVQFHPSYTYEDFIEGLRPVTAKGAVEYEVRPGLFQKLCDRARGQDATHVLVIDEINRADVGSVLGELMLLLEYRGKVVELPYSQKRFSIPRNVIVLATMNTADRSLALVDFALRRRFNAVAMRPDRSVLEQFLTRQGFDDEHILKMFEVVQHAVDDPDLAPGHSYWMRDDVSAAALDRVWRYELRPYLEEHWHERPEALATLDDDVAQVLAEQV